MKKREAFKKHFNYWKKEESVFEVQLGGGVVLKCVNKC